MFLQEMVENIFYDTLPANWTSLDLNSFSSNKQLWDYQQQALKNTIKFLWKYYEDFYNWDPEETQQINSKRKTKLYNWYHDNGFDGDINLLIKKNNKLKNLLENYYEIENGKISYQHFINRACFWMATGSGKTLVIIKLIELLRELIKRGEIPPHDILFLTHRDDLINQFKKHVEEFNAAHSDLNIKLRELRDYAEVKRESPSLFKDWEITVFYYRSDNINDEQKEKIIDFANFDNEGKWYILLDEAHKGDKEDSKRQHIYSILSRNGFLFNFSATFTDQRDYLTTLFNFNLSKFIRAGFGKHISILKQETRGFKEGEDYSNEEKKKVVLKSLIMLTYIHKYYEKVCNLRLAKDLYHKPLLLTLVNSVNTKDADLKLFFHQLEKIGQGEISNELWKTAKEELWTELKQKPPLMLEEDFFKVKKDVFDSLNHNDILKHVYNASGAGDIEVFIRPSNKQELVFKLKTSDRPFALIKIGDISGWLKEELSGYEVNEHFEDNSYFDRLNADDSDINILMGSRGFYEGWDSNRPNVINFINIGTGAKAKKFILQSVGRGVRIEPIKNKKKRLLTLYNSNEVEESLFQKLKKYVLPLETLFIFGTNRDVLQTVISELVKENKEDEANSLSLSVNEKVKQHKLLIPVYKKSKRLLTDKLKYSKFEITKDELRLLKNYIKYIGDERVLLALCDTSPEKINFLLKSLKNPDDYYKYTERKLNNNLELLIRRIINYFSIVPQGFKKFKDLKDEITHFKNIKIKLEDITELKNKISKVQRYKDPYKLEAELDSKFERGEISKEEYKKAIKKTVLMEKEEKVEYQGKQLKVKYISNHYYIPLILSGENEAIDFIQHIIQTPSEINFINHLEQYLEQENNKFKEFDWWLFSKLDESLDEVYIPYYNPKLNSISHFKPDFVFWLQKGNDYFIVFIDPKGTEHTDYEHKIDGYSGLFEQEGKNKISFKYGELNVKVYSFLNTNDVNKLASGYKDYWFDNIDKILTKILD
ncbi:MAG: type restriction enzyme [Clostridia bacterium]|nr:type restriction enzyme [Clostridia bacterium]